MIRISISDLDAFRYYKATEDMQLEDFLARLRREEPPTRSMLAGRALHKVLELDSWTDPETAECDGFKFRFVADCELAWLPVRELKGEMFLQTPSGPVTLVGVVDGLDGSIYDHKLTERFNAERYASSYQWRCYLTMFNARRFTYNVFEGREDMSECWVIHGFHPLTMWAYAGMREDVTREVSDFAAFIADNLPERVKEAA